MPSKKEETIARLIAEFKKSKGDVFEWKDIPSLVLVGVKFLALNPHHTGLEKKQILTDALVELCPDDDIDQLIPPFIDLVWTLVKRETCYAVCCCCKEWFCTLL